METMINIVLLPWTLIEWGFSLLVWYILFSWISNSLFEYGIDSQSIKVWFLNAWDDAKVALRFRGR